MIATVSSETLDEIEAVYTSKGMVVRHDEATSQDGYRNIIVSLAPFSLFGHTLILKVEE